LRIDVALTLVLLAIIASLGYRLYRATRQIKELKARMVEVDRMKKNFISHVSHELKAPLASMQETSHLMLERIPGPLTEKQQRLLELNLQSGKRLAQMIGNILDLSRLQAGIVEYEMQRQDLTELIHGVIVELTVQAREKTLRVLTDIEDDPLMVDCDSNRLVQVFTNLLENAFRFSGRGGAVSVHVKSVKSLPERMPQSARVRIPPGERATSFAVIAISDTGPGIQDEHKEQIFHMFHQVHQGKKSLGESFGLGLAIARAVVEAHRGTIWVEDNPNGGSIFFVILPIAGGKRPALRKAS
jgi:two-component system sensor histidine kinase GlrK